MWLTLAQDAENAGKMNAVFSSGFYSTPIEDVLIVWVMIMFVAVQIAIATPLISWPPMRVARWSRRNGGMALFVAAIYAVWVWRRSLGTLIDRGGSVDIVEIAAAIGPALGVMTTGLILCAVGFAVSWFAEYRAERVAAE